MLVAKALSPVGSLESMPFMITAILTCLFRIISMIFLAWSLLEYGGLASRCVPPDMSSCVGRACVPAESSRIPTGLGCEMMVDMTTGGGQCGWWWW